MAGSAIIGKVAVKVLPDTSDFRREAERKLSALEKTLRPVSIPTKIDMSGASREFLVELQKINQRNRTSDARKIRFHTTISTNGMREEITKARRRLETLADQAGVKFRVGVDDIESRSLDVKLKLHEASIQDAQDELDDFVDRNSPLIIPVHPDVNNVLAAASSAKLAHLSRPRDVPLIPRVSKAAAAKAATALAALSGARLLNTTLSDLSRMLGNLDKNLPKLAAVGIGIAGITTAALSAASNLFALSSSLASIAGAGLALPGIFGGLAVGLGITIAALKDFNQQMPQVAGQLAAMQDIISENFWATAKAGITEFTDTILPAFTAETGRTAGLIGTYFGNLSSDMAQALGPRLTGMFQNLNKSIDTATRGTGGLADAVAILGTQGSNYLPRLANFFVDITDRFAAFLSKAEKSGELQQWIDQGIEALKALGDIIVQTVRIFGGLGRAALDAGGAPLQGLADGLRGIADVINSPAFQTQLTRVFEAAHTAMSEIATISGPAVKDMFLTIGDTVSTLLPMVGGIIGTLLRDVATALSNPVLQTGIITMFEQIGNAVDALTPLWPVLAEAIGNLMPVIGTLAETFAPILTAAFQVLGDAIALLAPALQPLIEALGGALLQVIEAISPYIGEIVTAFVNMLPAVTDLIDPLARIVTSGLELMATYLPLVVGGFELLGEILTGIAEGANLVADVFEAVALALTGDFSGAVDAILGRSTTLVGGLLTDQGKIGAGFKTAEEQRLANTKDFLNANERQMGESYRRGAVELERHHMDSRTSWERFYDNTLGRVSTFGADMRNKFSLAWDAIRTGISNFISQASSNLSNGWSNMVSTAQNWWGQMVKQIEVKVFEAINWVRQLPARAVEAVGNLGSRLVAAGRSLIDGFISGIQSAFGRVRETLSNLTSMLPSWKGPPERDAILLKDAGRLVIDGFITGLESRYDAVRKSLRGLTDDVAGTQFDPLAVDGGSVVRRLRLAADGVSATSGGGNNRTLNYYAAPGSSLGSEEDLFAAGNRARMGW